MLKTILLCIVLFERACAVTYTCDPTASCGCTIPSVTTSARIVGGEEVSSRAWGWMLSLQYKGNHICGATLISPEFAFTSAHCLSTNPDTLRNFTVVAGTNYLDDTSARVQRRNILALYVYPSFNYSFFRHDVAMIRFEPFTIGSDSSVSVICVANQQEDPFTVGQDLIAIGWGVETYGSAVIANVLRQVTVQAMATDSADCQNVNIRDPVARFCAGVSGGGKDTCQGDSGGPLMAYYNNRWYLAGVPTSGQGCARAGYPGIYTRVSQYKSYVQYVYDNPDNATVSLVSLYSGNSSSVTTTTLVSTASTGSSSSTTTLASSCQRQHLFTFSSATRILAMTISILLLIQ